MLWAGRDYSAFSGVRFLKKVSSVSISSGAFSITRSIVAMHHGAIRVYSREGEGTTFVVRMPLMYLKE